MLLPDDAPSPGLRSRLYVLLDHADLGSASFASLDQARWALLSVVKRTRDRMIEIDLRTKRVGASFIGILASAVKIARSRGNRLVVINAHPRVREVFETCGYEELLA